MNYQELTQLFSRHNKDGFITRLDRSSVYSKRFNFAKGFAANITILLSLGWLVTTIVKHDLAAPLPRAFKTAACLTQYLLIAWAIITILLSTSFPFFFGECRLRLIHGFRPTEIIIRDIPTRVHSRTHVRGSAGKGHEYQNWKSILRSIDARLVFYNPLALLSEDFWILDYDAVLHAYKLITAGKLDEADFEFAIWRPEQGVWKSHEAWRIHAVCVDQHITSLIKSNLVMQGKEQLFTLWQSTLHAESDPAKAYRTIVECFVHEGIDYEQFWSQLFDSDSSSKPFSAV